MRQYFAVRWQSDTNSDSLSAQRRDWLVRTVGWLWLALGLGLFAAGCGSGSEQAQYQRAVSAARQADDYKLENSSPAPSELKFVERVGGIDWILQQLGDARISSLPVAPGVSPEANGPLLTLSRGGTALLFVSPAENCYEKSGGRTCRVHPAEILVSKPGAGTWRVVSPRLGAWLSAGDGDANGGSSTEIPDAAQVRRIEFGLRGPLRTQYPMPLDPARPGERTTIEKVIGWLNNGDRVSSSSEAIDVGTEIAIRTPKSLIQVAAAWDCTRTTNSLFCNPNLNEVILQDQSGGSYHLRAPDLASWLAVGWTHDVRYGTPDEAAAAARD
jgi:hypothetical protein